MYESDNFHALKNLGALYVKMEKYELAVEYLGKAIKENPDVTDVLMLYANSLEKINDIEKASQFYKRVLKNGASYEVEIEAEESLTRIAMTELKSKGFRVDVVMYLSDAIEKFSKLEKDKVQSISFEIATLGMDGIDINNSEKKFTLNTINGSFSGLQLVCMMFVGFKIIDDKLPPVADFMEEYKAALKMRGQKVKSKLGSI